VPDLRRWLSRRKTHLPVAALGAATLARRADRGAPGGRPPGLALPAGLAALFLVAGCAAVPTSGLLQSTNLPSGSSSVQQGSDCCGLIMHGPGPNWNPGQIVRNFILASADFANGHAIARQYLTPAASKSWLPGPGPAVTVIAQTPTVTSSHPLVGPQNTVAVQISVQELGKVTTSGQYKPAAGGRAVQSREFTLQRVNRQWRIANLPNSSVDQPSNELLLTKDLFQLAYQPRNLYYLDPTGKYLVPDPVFVPVDTTDPANDLVRALLASPQGWLAPGVLSAFPPAAQLRHPVAVPPGSKTAIVDLSLPASATTQSSLAQMSAQLVWTLTSSSYGSSHIQAVKLMVNGRAWIPPGATSAVQDRLDYPQPALTQPAHQNLYYLTTGGAARVLGGQGTTSAPLPGAAGTGRIQLSSIAVSPDGRYLAGVAGPSGSATLYTEDLSAAAKEHASPAARELRTRLSGVQLTAISWDRNDNLWVAGASRHKVRMWLLRGNGGAPVQVGLPAGTGQITAMRVAPDGVRMAMITSVKSKTSLALAAIARTNYQVVLFGPGQAGQVGADLSQPTALSWYDPDHLLVVNQSRAGPQLMEVPVDGDRSSYQGIEPGMVSISAAGSHNSIVASLQSGFLAKTVGLGELWNQFLPGRDATYPG
jgi:Lipoprotein LpqB beta-propeller domain/Sporulation and spore germination